MKYLISKLDDAALNLKKDTVI